MLLPGNDICLSSPSWSSGDGDIRLLVDGETSFSWSPSFPPGCPFVVIRIPSCASSGW